VTFLQTKGFIERYVDERDGRVSLLFITEKGKESLLSAKQDRRNAYLKILSDLTIEETEIFAELLTRLNRKIEQRNKPR
jgi:DNA-binding MarR family transcriptional regulator